MIIALTGGVGGAKLVAGLARALPADDLTVVVNTADDFDHLGLRIMPDLDSVLYALAGLNDRERGWGRADETWHCRDAMAALGAPTWFNLGDKDLALHILRTHWLHTGQSYAGVARMLARRLGLDARVVPMSDQPVATMVLSGDGEIPFQDYFVRRRCEPRAGGFRYAGIDAALPLPQWYEPLAGGCCAGVVICPSNPFVSIEPILALRGVREAIAHWGVPVVAVSPIVGGRALKGPAAKMMAELGMDVSPAGVAERYRGLLGGMVVDDADAGQVARLRDMGLAVEVTDTVMTDTGVAESLARTALAMVGRLRREREAG
ncbi:2-phospho-L-lactate transferase [Pigmentiphaga soli]|uniref:2-phospho-L-lactate transferase n=1 Tax=Pigmentiphaga soli TaxID=1007095 RepID=A0ABP8GEJ5_9BURK